MTTRELDKSNLRLCRINKKRLDEALANYIKVKVTEKTID